MADPTQWFSTGEAAAALGITRDALYAALRAGAPESQFRLAGRRVFGQRDLERLRQWFAARGRPVATGESR
jgi:hypothetical protein